LRITLTGSDKRLARGCEVEVDGPGLDIRFDLRAHLTAHAGHGHQHLAVVTRAGRPGKELGSPLRVGAGVGEVGCHLVKWCIDGDPEGLGDHGGHVCSSLLNVRIPDNRLNVKILDDIPLH
jgi:hypothetical protein